LEVVYAQLWLDSLYVRMRRVTQNDINHLWVVDAGSLWMTNVTLQGESDIALNSSAVDNTESKGLYMEGMELRLQIAALEA
jgi:hypothetical protein